jgi:hypothetical protein
MPRTVWTPSIVPGGQDQTVYLVADRFGGLGTAYREIDIERTDSNHHRRSDVRAIQRPDSRRRLLHRRAMGAGASRDIALEIQSRCDINGHDVPETFRDFVDSYAGPDRQLVLRLA